jgi:SAM-dependent methyltransferase
VSGPPWHPYVFDAERRVFVGDFEGMYRAESEEGFDSWRQDDLSGLEPQICRLLLDQITFRSVLDLGCGKGAFTASLKRRDNEVVGVDASETAVAIARERYPDLEWICAPAGDYVSAAGAVDLIVVKQLVSYLEDWRGVLETCAQRTRYCLVSLYLPEDPIGFVKSHDELAGELVSHFRPLETLFLATRSIGVHLLETSR